MKRLTAIFFALFAAAAIGSAAPELGPDVAVVHVLIGKERKPQTIVIGLYDSAAPLTVANFKELIHRKFYNGIRFHRVYPNSFVQTGDPKSRWGDHDLTGTGGPGYTVPAEIGLKNGIGAVGMARLPDSINPAKASNGSQFYFCLAPLPKLDGQYTVFGQVLSGMDVLGVISNEAADANDFPLAKVVIKSITISPRNAGPASLQ
jgi:cyclophilin family peptidyl-prolyl cis-trans isomerase